MPAVYPAPAAFQTADATITAVAPAALQAPVAAFTTIPESPVVGFPAPVTLVDSSTLLPDTIEWDFNGDGVYEVVDAPGTARVQQFMPGTHTIRMRATNALGSSITSRVLVVTAQ